MEEFNFASQRVQELIARLQGVTFICAVAMAAVNGNQESNGQSEHQIPNSEKVQKSDQSDATARSI